GDSTTTGSIAQSAPATLNQPMPPSLGAQQNTQVAAMQFLPPANVGSGGGGGNMLPPAPVNNGFMQPASGTSPIGMSAPVSTVQTQALPALNSSSPMGTQQAMQAQQTLAPLPAAPAAVAMGAP